VFSTPIKTGVFDDPVISAQADQFNAGAAGNFDIRFSFSSTAGHQFGYGDSVQYVVSRIPYLSVYSFRFPINPLDQSALHIQADDGTDGWVAGGFGPNGVNPHVGDFSGDGFEDVTDIPALINALSDVFSYKAEHGLTDSEFEAAGNFQNLPYLLMLPVTNLDVQEEIDYIANQGIGSLTAVPEPDSFVLFCVGGIAIALAGRRSQR
jgi:hypothetical protein